MGITSWKDVFLACMKVKYTWGPTPNKNNSNNSTSNQQQEKKDKAFNIEVSARFKPKSEINDMSQSDYNERKIALPLYQRLALIQMSRNLKTKKEAFQALFQQGGWFGEEMKERNRIDYDNDDDDDVVEEETT